MQNVELTIAIQNPTFEAIEQIIDKLDSITKKYPYMVVHVEVQL